MRLWRADRIALRAAALLCEPSDDAIRVDRGFASVHPPTIVLAGTRTMHDMLLNAKILSAPWTDAAGVARGHVHRGVAQKLERVLRDDGLRRALRDGRGVHVAGHSLGGAVAVLLGLHLESAGHRVHAVVTLGAPPAFDESLVASYAALAPRTFRYVTPSDPVARSMPFYRHIGRPVELPHDLRASPLNHHDAGTYRAILRSRV